MLGTREDVNIKSNNHVAFSGYNNERISSARVVYRPIEKGGINAIYTSACRRRQQRYFLYSISILTPTFALQ